MKNKRLLNIMEDIDEKYIEEATPQKKSSHSKWVKWVSVAASLALVVGAGAAAVHLLGITSEDTGKETQDIIIGESYIEWAWEYKTLDEKYTNATFDGETYVIKASTKISNTGILSEELGEAKVYGFDTYTNKVYQETVSVYAINGIDKEALIAVGLDNEFYVYGNKKLEKPNTFGEVLDMYALADNLTFGRFSVCEGYGEGEYRMLEDDSYIWDILVQCMDGKVDNSADSFDRSDRNYLTFTATSEALGVYKRVVYISEDGYFATNIFDYSYVYYIGEDAAKQIINYAKENSVKIEEEPYATTVSGIITEIGDDYIIVDDTDLCKNPKDGVIYKINATDLRIRRYVETGRIEVDDVVVISYRGSISEDNEIVGAYSIDVGKITDDGVAVPE